MSEVYLTLVNQTILVSNSYASTWSDWDNMGKLYQAKLEGVGWDVPTEGTPECKLKQFANFAFPEVQPETPEELVKLLTSKYVEALRMKMKDAADQKILLDSEWARQELLEERQASREAKTVRSIVGWCTVPLVAFHIPGHILGKATEEIVGHVVDHKKLKRFHYLYFLNNRFRSKG